MRKHLPLAAILALAAAVRLWGVDFGLPHTLARPDEDVVFGVARDIFKGDLNPHFFSYPSFFLYVVAALYSAYFWLGRAFGWFASEAAFLHQSVVHVGPFVLMARLVSVAAGTATVWVLFRTARRLFDQTTALVAALFLAFAVLHVRDSHFGVTDVTAALFLLVSFLFVVRLADTENLRDLVMAGLTAGLAASTKYNAALIVLPAFWVLVGPGSRRPATWTRRGLGVATYGGTALVGFLLASPYVALDWPAFREALQFEALHLRLGHGVDLGQGWSAHLFTSLGSGFGMVPLAIGVAGLLVLLRRDWRRGILVAVFPIAYYLALGSSRSVFVRYMIPVVPFLCLGAAVAVVACAGWAADRLRRPAWSVAMTWGLALLVAAPSVVRVGRLDDLLSRTDSRVLGAQWIEAAFPDGVSVGQLGSIYGYVQLTVDREGRIGRYPMLGFDQATGLFAGRGRAPEAEPGVIVIQQPPIPHYAESADALTQRLRAHYALLTSVAAFSPEQPGRRRVYDRQDAFYLPLDGFDGIDRPGPNLLIYVRSELAGAIPAAASATAR